MSCIKEYVESRPPHALFKDNIGRVAWHRLDEEQTAAYANMLNVHIQAQVSGDRPLLKFQRYRTHSSTHTHDFVVVLDKVFFLASDACFHQVRQFEHDDLADAQEQLAQIITAHDFAQFEPNFAQVSASHMDLLM